MQDIVVVFASPEDSKRIKGILMRSGLRVSSACTSGGRALLSMEELGGGLVVCGYRLRDMGYSELAANLPPSFRMLLLASQSKVEKEELPPNVQLLTMPLKAQELVQAAEQILKEVWLRHKREKTRRKVHSEAELKTIERAKELLMSQNNMTEPEAHKYLQKCAMDSGTNIVETAEMILLLLDKEIV